MLYRRLLTPLCCLLLCSLLSACMGAVVAGAALGGVVVNDGRSLTQQKDDLLLMDTINKQLSTHRALVQHSHLAIAVYDRVVLLTGQTPTEAYKMQAEAIVAEVPGIKRIYNEIAISGPIATLTQSSDSWITTKVKSHLLAEKNLKSGNIKVVTENGTVYLMGKVSREQASLASKVTSHVVGVQRVVTLFEYR